MEDLNTQAPPPPGWWARVRTKVIWVARFIAYTAMASAGFFALLATKPPTLSAFGWLAVLWSAFLLIGGALALVGFITQRWAIEKIGLPLLTSAITMYGIAILAASQSRPGTIAVGALCVGIGAEFFARLVGVSHELKVIEHLTTEQPRPDRWADGHE